MGYPLQYSWASLVAQTVKNPPAVWETWFVPWVGKILFFFFTLRDIHFLFFIHISVNLIYLFIYSLTSSFNKELRMLG